MKEWFDLPQPPESRGASYMWPKRSPKCRTQSTTAYSLFWKKQDNRNCKGTKKRGNREVFFPPHQNLKLVQSQHLFFSSLVSSIVSYTMKKKKGETVKVFDSCSKRGFSKLHRKYTSNVYRWPKITQSLISKECIMWLINHILKHDDESNAS